MSPSHPELLWIVVTCGISCAILAISIGANDVANSFSTSVGSGTLKLPAAITIAFIFEILGSITLGGTVSDAVRTRVVRFSVFADSPYELALGMLCASLGATVSLLISTYFGMPISTTHSIIGALAGFGVASGRFNGFRWVQLLYIVLSWVIVPFAAVLISSMVYIMIQELILKSSKSYAIMKYFHWILLGIFSIPLSVFIAFQNSFLRASTGEVAEKFRAWFHASKWNQFINVLVVLVIVLLISCTVTYSIFYMRLKSGWSYLESVKNLDSILLNTPSDNVVGSGNTEPDNTSNLQTFENENENMSKNKEDPERSGEETRGPGDSGESTSSGARRPVVANPEQPVDRGLGGERSTTSKFESECEVTIDPSSAMEMNIGGERVEIMEVRRNTFSRSVIDVLLTSVGFARTPKVSSHSSYFPSNNSSFFDGHRLDLRTEDQSSSKLNRFLSNIKTSYSRTMSFRASRSTKSRYSMHQSSDTNSRATRNASTIDMRRFENNPYTENIEKTQLVFSCMQIVGATMSIIAHSANDTANAVSPFATVLYLYLQGVQQESTNTPWYVLFLGGMFMSLGLALFGYKIIKTVGINITRVTPSRGYIIDCTTASIVSVISHIGVPLSSTHVAVSSILGIGMVHHLPFSDKERAAAKEVDPESGTAQQPQAERAEGHVDRPPGPAAKRPAFLSKLTTRNVNLKLYRKIFFTWIITVFSSGFLTAIFSLIARLIYYLARQK